MIRTIVIVRYISISICAIEKFWQAINWKQHSRDWDDPKLSQHAAVSHRFDSACVSKWRQMKSLQSSTFAFLWKRPKSMSICIISSPENTKSSSWGWSTGRKFEESFLLSLWKQRTNTETMEPRIHGRYLKKKKRVRFSSGRADIPSIPPEFYNLV